MSASATSGTWFGQSQAQPGSQPNAVETTEVELKPDEPQKANNVCCSKVHMPPCRKAV